MESFWLEVRLSARKLARRPGFSLSMIFLVALGVGGGSTVFTLVQGLLLRPPSGIAQPERIVRLDPMVQREIGAATYADYEYYRDNARTFSELFGYDAAATTVQVRAASTLTDSYVRFVTGNFFSGLGVRPLAGRLLNRDDDREQAENALVISDVLRQRLFPTTAAALGQTISLNGHVFTIAGIADREFRGAAHDDAPVDLWAPMWKRPLVTGRPRMDLVRTPDYIHAFMTTMGRLAPGVTIEQAQANLSTIGEQVARLYSDGSNPRVEAKSQFGLAPERRAAIVTLSQLLGGLALIVLLIICANLANLMLARALGARSETAVKLALGASRYRLVREYALESMVLGLSGGALGLLFASWGARALSAVLPFRLAAAPTLDLRVFGFALALAMTAAFVCGVLPGVMITRRTTLQSSATRVTGGGAAARTALVVTQVALCFLLLCGATMFLRSLKRVHDIPLGFAPEGVLALTFDLRAHGYTDETAPAAYDRLLQRMRALPGVRSAAVGSIVPLSGGRRTGPMEVEGRPVREDQRLIIDNNVVSPGYFQTVGMALLRGRDFTDADARSAPIAVVINQTLAKTYFPEQDPIGKRIGRNGNWWQIIGVVADHRTTNVTEAAVPMYYRAFAQNFFPRMQVYLRATGDPRELITAARRAVEEVDPNIVPRSVDALGDVYARAIRSYTVNARLVGVLGVLALVLAAVGLYAVTAYLVAQRTKELGVRMAIGAQSFDVLRDILGGAARRALLGLVIGFLATISLLPAVERFLFDLSPLDPVTFIAAGSILTLATLLASALPARRATLVDPLVALRSD
jgi:predicted permease